MAEIYSEIITDFEVLEIEDYFVGIIVAIENLFKIIVINNGATNIVTTTNNLVVIFIIGIININDTAIIDSISIKADCFKFNSIDSIRFIKIDFIGIVVAVGIIN